MILIADGGSTKVDWILLTDDGKELTRTKTKSLNPNHTSSELLLSRLAENLEISEVKEKISSLYFYGAGCNNPSSMYRISLSFKSFFPNAKIDIKEDMHAAVYSVTNSPSMVCILGTGSNVCYFDGTNIEVRVVSLGYILMDEASGNYFGKKLIQDYFHHQMPEKERSLFENNFETDSNIIRENLYRKESPNRYLATFAPFLFEQKNADYCQKVLLAGIREFFEKRILYYEESRSLPIHFVGSIAYFASDIIKLVASEYSLEIGKIVKRPIEGLLEYHKSYICKN